MLFQINYTTREGGSAQENEASGKRALALFSKWSPPAGFDIKSFHARADGRGGTLVVEANDVTVLAEGTAKFGAVNEFEIVPILDITEAVTIYAEAAAWADSIA
jgi:Protein of unknown function (DUF3303)